MDRDDSTLSDSPNLAASVKTVNLALQGGGAHGAFTLGVLDRLMEDELVAIDGISATSAGAMNGAILVHGLQLGGRAGARGLLRQCWRRVADCARISPILPTLLDRLAGNHNLEHSPVYQAFDLMTRMMSPYQLKPFDYNPLRDILLDLIDFDE